MRLWEAYKDRVQFLLVYIREAHPTDGWQVPINERQGVLYRQPRSEEEREKVASDCRLHLRVPFPTVIDNMDNATGQAYQASPDRLYVVDKEGKLYYCGARGPRGFRPDELAEALQKLAGPPAGQGHAK